MVNSLMKNYGGWLEEGVEGKGQDTFLGTA